MGTPPAISIFVMPVTVWQANLFHREQRKSLGHAMVPVTGLRRMRWSHPAGSEKDKVS